MECPKCHKRIEENATVCPYCHKVLTLECPNCHSLTNSPICDKCGYTILIKCSKCGKTVSTKQEKCKCGFPVKTSIAYQECETDEFASIIIKFSALQNIRRVLGSQELFTKFYFRLRNLLIAQIKSVEGKVIIYNDTFVINFNKELSFPTSANKAIRLAIKLANAFADLNLKVIKELGTPLKLNLTIAKKTSEELLEESSIDNNVKLLNIKQDEAQYLKGMQIILDQYIWDCVNKDYKTDSLYTVEKDGITLMFYELLLPNYVLPPSNDFDEAPVIKTPTEVKKQVVQERDDIYAFKVFEINAKCSFKKIPANKFVPDESKIISIRAEKDLEVSTSSVVNFYKQKGMQILHATCTEELNYKPWGVFEQLFKDFYNLSLCKTFFPQDFELKRFNALKNLVFSKPRKSATPEDARFAYMEDFSNFIASLKNTVIIIDGFEFMDDTSIQTLDLYFDNFKKLNVNFVFTTNSEISLHSKFKRLLRTSDYTEFLLQKSTIGELLGDIKEEASDFIQSFYFEKIKEQFNGSTLYFQNALKFLSEKNILINFENRLLIKSKNSVVLPNTLEGILKARLKAIGKNVDTSMLLAYSVYLGARIDLKTLEKLGIKDVSKNAKMLEQMDFVHICNDVVYINNYNLLKPVLVSSLKKQVEEFLCKNILANLGKDLDDTLVLLIMGKLGFFKEEYLLLWRNSQFAMATGDYDAYLKNCLGFLSLIEHIENNISEEDIENNKKEVYENILMSLYNYSPTKIYSIENVLLTDAIKKDDNDKIVKLSNLMLQGALITSNYAEALQLLYNILSRMPNPTLVVDGVINTKFLLLSLINIEILFNIGDFAQCVQVAKDLIAVIKPEMIEKIKPASFSIKLFIEHLFETFRLVGIAKLFLMDDDIEEFFDAINNAFGEALPDKDVILAIRDYLSGKTFAVSDIENATPFAKVIYLILQEFSEHSNDYKAFAQNIYQAKLLAADIHQLQLELFCDLLIAQAYANTGIAQKAEAIFNDVLKRSTDSAILIISLIAKYFIAKLMLSTSRQDEALLIINDALALLQKNNNQSKLFFVLFEKLFIDVVQEYNVDSVNIEPEIQKLAIATADGKLSRLID